MRELFGQRPEPWIELQSVEAHPEQFTVTSEPFPSVGDYSISAADMMDVRLEAVPDLSQLAKPSAPLPTVPVRVTADPDLAPTLQTAPAPQSNPYPVLSSASHGAYVARASAANLRGPHRSKLLLVIAPAQVLGAVLGIALAFGSRGTKAPAAHATPPPVQPIIMQTTPVDAAPAPPVVAVPEPVDAAPPAPPDVATLYKDHQYADVVTACNASKSTLATNVTACTVAACKEREVSKARRWFAGVAAAKRANVQRECGTILPADKPATADDECKRDPLACQH
jgi:hypothetical protein